MIHIYVGTELVGYFSPNITLADGQLTGLPGATSFSPKIPGGSPAAASFDTIGNAKNSMKKVGGNFAPKPQLGQSGITGDAKFSPTLAEDEEEPRSERDVITPNSFPCPDCGTKMRTMFRAVAKDNPNSSDVGHHRCPSCGKTADVDFKTGKAVGKPKMAEAVPDTGGLSTDTNVAMSEGIARKPKMVDHRTYGGIRYLPEKDQHQLVKLSERKRVRLTDDTTGGEDKDTADDADSGIDLAQMDDGADLGIKKHVNEQLLKYAAGQSMFCPSCKKVLDWRNAVNIDHPTAGNSTLCGDCFDKVAKRILDSGKGVDPKADIVDGRVLTGKKRHWMDGINPTVPQFPHVDEEAPQQYELGLAESLGKPKLSEEESAGTGNEDYGTCACGGKLSKTFQIGDYARSKCPKCGQHGWLNTKKTPASGEPSEKLQSKTVTGETQNRR